MQAGDEGQRWCRSARLVLRLHLRCLTFELSGRRRQDARARRQKMYSVPAGGPWWPAVGAPLERGVRPHLAEQMVPSHWTSAVRLFVVLATSERAFVRFSSLLLGVVAATDRVSVCWAPARPVLHRDHSSRFRRTASNAVFGRPDAWDRLGC